MSNCSVPSTHAERKITVRSHKHSFTPYPSLSPYRQTDGITDRETNTFAACVCVFPASDYNWVTVSA